MRNSSRLIVLLSATLLILVASTAIVSMRGLGQRNVSPNEKAQQKIDFANRFPIAEYAAPEPTDPKERAKRRSKDKRFPKGTLDDVPGATETQIVDGRGSPSLQALPVDLSDLIVIGNVLNAEAYLSSDKTGIFSEFIVSIEEVLKITGSDPVLPGTNISIEREGARIRYPSGQVRLVRFDREAMPMVGGRYLFFLRRTTQESPYTILTGYELRASRVFPLDGVAPFEERKLPQFAIYDGVEEILFLRTVRGLLN